MIQVANLSKSFGSQVLFKDLSFCMNKGDKFGFIGRNGSGKTTLFKLLTGEMTADEGEINFPRNYKVACLPQHIKFHQKTVIDECREAFHLPDSEVYRLEKILFGLGFSKLDLQKDPKQFSGGYQLRINLAKMLATESDLLLLDEPSNYLDIVSMRWLKSYLKSFQGEFILITHDRDFMDEVVTHVIGIHRKQIRKIQGTTRKYFDQIEQEEIQFERTQRNLEDQRRHLEEFVDRFRAKANKASQAQSKLKQLQKLPELERLNQEKVLSFRFNYKPCYAKDFLKVNKISFSYGENKVIEDFSFDISQGDRIAVIGRNGKGKSTLLNLLAGILIPSSGQITYHGSASIGHFGQTNIDHLDPNNTIVQEIQASDGSRPMRDIRSICGAMLFEGDLADKKIEVLSGGEKSRVLLGKLLVLPTNILLLDEPTNHLDVESIDVLLRQIDDYPGTVVMVSHDEGIVKKFANKLVVFQKDTVDFFVGNYDYFLKKIGWIEEEDNRDRNDSGDQKKNIKKLKSDFVRHRSQILGPLKKRISQVEDHIMNLEEKEKKLQDEIMIASTDSDSETIIRCSKELNLVRKQIEEEFEALEILIPEYEILSSDLDKQYDEMCK